MFDFSRSTFDSSLLFLAFVGLIAAWLMARTFRVDPSQQGQPQDRPAIDEAVELAGASTTALLAAGLLFGDVVSVLPIYALFLATAAFACYFVPRLSMPGTIWLTAETLGIAVGALWTHHFIAEAEFPRWIEQLANLGLFGSIAMFTVGLSSRVAREALLTHHLWRLPTAAPAPFSAEQRFKVSIQLPCYAEPPEVVKETMNRLAALHYDNYEVCVIDNNTQDEALWRPLEAHCALLNKRLGREHFRFFHVAPLPGAKAGALNYLLDGQMADDADLIAVIDADYYSRPDFLSRLVAFFDDPAIGYVQTPHDYRDYENSDYLSACYWEYMPNNKIDMPGVSEYGGAFTIGTMCILRTEALRKAGGWAEWCLTEDSEVSVRLRAVGYEGIYLGETFGRGLIPDTFDDYKKQRFRWTAGPVQQLRRHWRLFLPAPLAPAMPGWTKVLEVLRCIYPVQTLLGLASAFAGTCALGFALATDNFEPIDIPNVSWLLMMVGAVTWWIRTSLRYQLSGSTSVKDVLHGEIARMSLTYVVLLAGVAGLSKRPLAWRRTPKFALEAADPSPFASTVPETVLGGAHVLLTIGALLLAPALGFEMALLIAFGFATMAFRFFCAPYMAAMAIRHARQEIGTSGPVAADVTAVREATT
ncbi:glycosyltransferase [Sphingobium sufflavum]|uniref:glycosyltransferase family 2 protein n=1 Tax=Sphingobium sufflavum TaxID=1129547 RepID=UPI001F24AA89|nr:glycosyltransferase [Sphingobium sufflavum]MCE7795769.1 glycosyltransferase [Sphingobium sufflavum]